ncbi:uncharacterized protein LOC114936265 [Nylanderia fulva]|uniref:uncharacterized protein LOC114936265 n=1 Tax=Nylanderia fulva TaxID=613905 RepID=UPI0010FAE5F8|nr:uncharacterized protein LOC114936265 [Nylanderia fulva]
MKFFVVLFAIVAVASAGLIHHGPEIIHVGNQPSIPGPKASPLALHGNDHSTRIHYSAPHIGHPHLVGVEHYNPAPHYEPSVVNVALKHDWH